MLPGPELVQRPVTVASCSEQHQGTPCGTPCANCCPVLHVSTYRYLRGRCLGLSCLSCFLRGKEHAHALLTVEGACVACFQYRFTQRQAGLVNCESALLRACALQHRRHLSGVPTSNTLCNLLCFSYLGQENCIFLCWSKNCAPARSAGW